MSMTTPPVLKHLDGAIKAIDGSKIQGIASQQQVDRDGEVILVNGIGTSRFEPNPCFLANHDRDFNLGTVTRLWTATLGGVATLLFEAQLVERPTERQREVIEAIRQGARRGISIGFIPLETDRQPVVEGQRGVTYTSIELLEISSVSLPSCPTCLIEQKALKRSACACDDDVIVLHLRAEPVRKVGARHSASDMATLHEIHSAVVALGSRCDEYDVPPADDAEPVLVIDPTPDRAVARFHRRDVDVVIGEVVPDLVLDVLRDVVRTLPDTIQRQLRLSRGRVD